MDHAEQEEEHLYEPKEEIVEETIFEENVSEPEETTVKTGQEGADYENVFTVCKLFYRGQFNVPESNNWIIRSNSLDEFHEHLFTLAQPFMKRAIEFCSNEPRWVEKELPTKEDLNAYLTFKDRIQKRVWKLQQVDENMLIKWANKIINIQLYTHSHHITSRPAWDLVRRILFDNTNDGDSAARQIVKEISEEQKLHSTIRRLEKVHRAYLVPKVDDAFKLWAQLILKAPARRHSELCYSKPPASLLSNFLELDKPEPRKRKIISGPARREHAADGFGFEDEVQALRQTVTQIKDLVEMLDRRVVLLEEKCHGFKQAVQTVPPKKSKWKECEENNEEEPNEEEPVIDEPALDDTNDNDDVGADGFSGNPDPLLFNQLVEYVKEEDEFEADD